MRTCNRPGKENLWWVTFSEAFSERVGLCTKFIWVSCCCTLCVYYWRSESICGSEMAAWSNHLLLGCFEEEKNDFCSLPCCALAGLSCARAPLVKTLLEGKGRSTRSIGRGGFITEFPNPNLHRVYFVVKGRVLLLLGIFHRRNFNKTLFYSLILHNVFLLLCIPLVRLSSLV